VVEVVPEGIFIYDPVKKRTLLTNSEMQRLLEKYAAALVKSDYDLNQEEKQYQDSPLSQLSNRGLIEEVINLTPIKRSSKDSKKLSQADKVEQ
jgi:hypothetical protein